MALSLAPTHLNCCLRSSFGCLWRSSWLTLFHWLSRWPLASWSWFDPHGQNGTARGSCRDPVPTTTWSSLPPVLRAPLFSTPIDCLTARFAPSWGTTEASRAGSRNWNHEMIESRQADSAAGPWLACNRLAGLSLRVRKPSGSSSQ